MACCPTVPSHYLNQCWLIIKGVLWHSYDFSQKLLPISMSLKIALLKLPKRLMSHWVKLNHSETKHWPLIRYIKLWVAHAPRLPGTFSPPTRVSDPDMHHGTCVTHVPRCIPAWLTSGFLWSRWRRETFPAFPRMRNLQVYVSGKRPMRQPYAYFMEQIVCSVWY